MEFSNAVVDLRVRTSSHPLKCNDAISQICFIVQKCLFSLHDLYSIGYHINILLHLVLSHHTEAWPTDCAVQLSAVGPSQQIPAGVNPTASVEVMGKFILK